MAAPKRKRSSPKPGAREYLRCVVWPRQGVGGVKPVVGTKEGGKVYRYAIVGMFVTDTPIDGIEGQNEIVIDGDVSIARQLSTAPQRRPQYRLGDAASVMVSLNEIVGDSEFITRELDEPRWR